MLMAWWKNGRPGDLTLLALAALCVVPLLLQVPNPNHLPWLTALHNALHTPLFFIIQWLLLRLTGLWWPGLPLGRRVLLAAAVSLSLGGIVELLQGLIGRDPSWLDMQRNTMGIVAASLSYGCLRGRTHILRVLGCVALIGLLLSLPFIGVWRSWQDHQRQLQAFPQLLGKQVKAVQHHWRAVAGAEARWVDGAETTLAPGLLEVRLPGGRRWPGLMLVHPVADWSNYGELYFEVYSKHHKPANIAINLYTSRSIDQPRIYQRFRLDPGPNELRMAFPNQVLTGEGVIRVLWHSLSPGEDLLLYFSNIHLN